VDHSLLRRVLTGVVFLPVLFYLVHLGGWFFTAFLLLVILVGAWEWRRLVGDDRVGGLLRALGALALCLAVSRSGEGNLTLGLAGFLLLVMLVALWHRSGDSRSWSGDLLLGALYLGLLPAFLILMRALPGGRELVLLTYATVFCCDTAAYLIGRAWGRHPLWPRVSPRKTWEGAAAGLVAALLLPLALRSWGVTSVSPLEAAGFGLIVGTLGQAGDLIESRWKRERGIKDSSALLPGHGGVLDRFDNLHFVAPILYTYLVVIG